MRFPARTGWLVKLQQRARNDPNSFTAAHCDFVVPDPSSDNALSGILNHIRFEHPNSNPVEPARMSFAVSTDEELIDGYMEQQGSIERRACSREGCTAMCADDDSIALHWAEEHREAVTIEEVRRAIETDPERFRVQLAEIFHELEQEDARNRLAYREPEDGYVIHHSPSVPRVRSGPAESIVYVEREPVRFLDRELEELLESECWDGNQEVPPGEEWAEDRQQLATVELRFCNIVDGYIPLVKDVRGILPPLMDGEAIEVSWQGEHDLWFPCKVSRSKRAIYNLAGQLRPYSRLAKRYRVKQRGWRHNVYSRRIEEYRNEAGAFLEVRCGFGTPREAVFVIPISFLMQHVVPRAHCSELGRYLFTVNQNDYVFTWDHGLKMEGEPFLDRSESSGSAQDDRLSDYV